MKLNLWLKYYSNIMYEKLKTKRKRMQSIQAYIELYVFLLKELYIISINSDNNKEDQEVLLSLFIDLFKLIDEYIIDSSIRDYIHTLYAWRNSETDINKRRVNVFFKSVEETIGSFGMLPYKNVNMSEDMFTKISRFQIEI